MLDNLNITFRDLYIEKEIEINIPTNPRNTNQEPILEYKYFNEERYFMKE